MSLSIELQKIIKLDQEIKYLEAFWLVSIKQILRSTNSTLFKSYLWKIREIGRASNEKHQSGKISFEEFGSIFVVLQKYSHLFIIWMSDRVVNAFTIYYLGEI